MQKEKGYEIKSFLGLFHTMIVRIHRRNDIEQATVKSLYFQLMTFISIAFFL
jgi:hypothetical protein